MELTKGKRCLTPAGARADLSLFLSIEGSTEIEIGGSFSLNLTQTLSFAAEARRSGKKVVSSSWFFTRCPVCFFSFVSLRKSTALGLRAAQ